MTRECWGGPLDGEKRSWRGAVTHLGDFWQEPACYVGDYVWKETTARFEWRQASPAERRAAGAVTEMDPA